MGQSPRHMPVGKEDENGVPGSSSESEEVSDVASSVAEALRMSRL